jgi:hypothetical protein
MFHRILLGVDLNIPHPKHNQARETSRWELDGGNSRSLVLLVRYFTY